MGILKVRKYRSFNDFRWGSFQVYVTEKETVVRGILKKTGGYSPYIIVVER